MHAAVVRIIDNKYIPRMNVTFKLSSNLRQFSCNNQHIQGNSCSNSRGKLCLYNSPLYNNRLYHHSSSLCNCKTTKLFNRLLNLNNSLQVKCILKGYSQLR